MPKLLLFTLLAGTLAAQTIEIVSLYQPAPLAGVWKQKVGDDPRWASEYLDDFAWSGTTMPPPSRPGAQGSRRMMMSSACEQTL